MHASQSAPPPTSTRKTGRRLAWLGILTGLGLILVALPWTQVGWSLRSLLSGLLGRTPGFTDLALLTGLLFMLIAVVRIARAKRGRPRQRPMPLPLLVALAILLLGGGLTLTFFAERIVGLLGPPRVEAREAYERREGGPRFDHRAFDRLLARRVDRQGLVDYAGLSSEPAALDAYLAAIAVADFGAYGRDEKLALLINAYNACTLRLILDHWPAESIQDIPADRRWKGRQWTIAGRRYTLDSLEHDELRKNFTEPRIHFAINCASIGCPPLRREAYVGSRIEGQLEDQARRVHGSPRFVRWNASNHELGLTRLYRWFAGDFEAAAGSTTAFVARYLPHPVPEDVTIRWLDYDWNLNRQTR